MKKHVCTGNFNQDFQWPLSFSVNESVLYKCSTCSLLLTSELKLELHTRRHDNNKPIQCHECGKQFYDHVRIFVTFSNLPKL